MSRPPVTPESVAAMSPEQRLYWRVVARVEGLISGYEAYYEFKKRDALLSLSKELKTWEPEDEEVPEPMTADEEMYCDPLYITDDPCSDCGGTGGQANDSCDPCKGTGRIPRICGEQTREGLCQEFAGHGRGLAELRTLVANMDKPPVASPELLALAARVVERQKQPMEGTIEEWAEKLAAHATQEGDWATAYDRTVSFVSDEEEPDLTADRLHAMLMVVEAARRLPMECDTCGAKPGAPAICFMCLQARRLRHALSALDGPLAPKPVVTVRYGPPPEDPNHDRIQVSKDIMTAALNAGLKEKP